jgi:hypothetical protein
MLGLSWEGVAPPVRLMDLHHDDDRRGDDHEPQQIVDARDTEAQ